MAPAAMRAYGELCAWTLARAHARSGDRIAIATYLGRSDVFDQAIAEFAAAYADQNERDYHALADAAGSGRVTAQRDLRSPAFRLPRILFQRSASGKPIGPLPRGHVRDRLRCVTKCAELAWMSWNMASPAMGDIGCWGVPLWPGPPQPDDPPPRPVSAAARWCGTGLRAGTSAPCVACVCLVLVSQFWGGWGSGCGRDSGLRIRFR
jgi:Uncharacterized protein conserved in bacteria (DUF2252)